MGGHSSLPNPGERSNSDSSGPPSLLWSPWLELGEANNQVLFLRLNTNPKLISQISHLESCIRSSSCSLSLKTPSLQFPFSQWIPWSAFPLNDSSPRKYMSSLSSLHWILLKYFLGLFGLVVINWATCSDPTFLGDHDPKCTEVATCNIGSIWGCCHLCFALHLVPSTSLTSNTLINSSPKLLSPPFIY